MIWTVLLFQVDSPSNTGTFFVSYSRLWSSFLRKSKLKISISVLHHQMTLAILILRTSPKGLLQVVSWSRVHCRPDSTRSGRSDRTIFRCRRHTRYPSRHTRLRSRHTRLRSRHTRLRSRHTRLRSWHAPANPLHPRAVPGPGSTGSASGKENFGGFQYVFIPQWGKFHYFEGTIYLSKGKFVKMKSQKTWNADRWQNRKKDEKHFRLYIEILYFEWIYIHPSSCPVILVAVIKVGDITVAVIWVGSEVWSFWSRSLRSRSFRSWSFLSVF